MRRILYPGGAFDTGDEIAAAVLDYARELARSDTADTVFVPGRIIDGEVGSVELLLGPASQLVSEPLDLGGGEIVDPDLVSSLHQKGETLARHRPGLWETPSMELPDVEP